jgi:hypothetical protein
MNPMNPLAGQQMDGQIGAANRAAEEHARARRNQQMAAARANEQQRAMQEQQRQQALEWRQRQQRLQHEQRERHEQDRRRRAWEQQQWRNQWLGSGGQGPGQAKDHQQQGSKQGGGRTAQQVTSGQYYIAAQRYSDYTQDQANERV